MKSRIFILTAAILVCTTLMPGKAKAWSFFPPPRPVPPVCPKGPTTTLPIDNDVVFLMIAGIVMGIATVKKAKSALIAVPVKSQYN